MQHDYTTVLACLVKTFPTKKEFRDLVQLTDYNDPESDFFEHMKHIQVREESKKTHSSISLLPDFILLLHTHNIFFLFLFRFTVEVVP